MDTWSTTTAKFVSCRLDAGPISESDLVTFPATYHLMTIVANYATATVTCYTNGVQCGNDSTWGTAGTTENTDSHIGFSFGATSCKASFAEFILYNHAISAADRTAWETYLKSKYGL
jgi:hypothetical protein